MQDNQEKETSTDKIQKEYKRVQENPAAVVSVGFS